MGASLSLPSQIRKKGRKIDVRAKNPYRKEETDMLAAERQSKIVELVHRQGSVQVEELAQELKVSTALISAYELGERKPSLDLLAGLADVFGVSSDYLLGLKHHVLYEIEGLSSEEIQVVRKLICLLQMRQYDRKKI